MEEKKLLEKIESFVKIRLDHYKKSHILDSVGYPQPLEDNMFTIIDLRDDLKEILVMINKYHEKKGN